MRAGRPEVQVIANKDKWRKVICMIGHLWWHLHGIAWRYGRMKDIPLRKLQRFCDEGLNPRPR